MKQKTANNLIGILKTTFYCKHY